MIVMLTCWGKLTRRKSPIVIEVPRSVKAEPNAQLTSLEIVVVVLAKCVNLDSRMG